MAKGKKHGKTNAVRLVEQQRKPFTLMQYDISDQLIDGVSVAKKTGQAIEIVFKTLVAETKDGEIFVFLIPVAANLDLKKAAKAANVKKIDLMPVQKLTKATGYVRGGCSPIGMKKLYPTFIDCSAEQLEEVVVSAGKPGLQMKIQLHDLLSLINAKVGDLQK